MSPQETIETRLTKLESTTELNMRDIKLSIDKIFKKLEDMQLGFKKDLEDAYNKLDHKVVSYRQEAESYYHGLENKINDRFDRTEDKFTEQLEKKEEKFKEEMAHYTRRSAFLPVKSIVYGGVGLALTAIGSAVIYTVLK